MKTSTIAPPIPVPPIVVLPSTSGVVITGGAGRVTTVTAADGTLVTPDTVWVAVTSSPATSAGTAIENEPAASTGPLATILPSTKILMLAPGTPVPLTAVNPSTSGGVSTGAGGRDRTTIGGDGLLTRP